MPASWLAALRPGGRLVTTIAGTGLLVTADRFPEVRALAAQCQQALAFPYYDPVPPQGLHMTLDRIAPEGGVTAAHMNSIDAAARLACQAIPPFRISLGEISGTRSAVGFTVTPSAPIRRLRDALRDSTLSVRPDALVRGQETVPHITVAYGNTDHVPATDAIAAVSPGASPTAPTSPPAWSRCPSAAAWNRQPWTSGARRAHATRQRNHQARRELLRRARRGSRLLLAAHSRQTARLLKPAACRARAAWRMRPGTGSPGSMSPVAE